MTEEEVLLKCMVNFQKPGAHPEVANCGAFPLISTGQSWARAEDY